MQYISFCLKICLRLHRWRQYKDGTWWHTSTAFLSTGLAGARWTRRLLALRPAPCFGRRSWSCPVAMTCHAKVRKKMNANSWPMRCGMVWITHLWGAATLPCNIGRRIWENWDPFLMQVHFLSFSYVFDCFWLDQWPFQEPKLEVPTMYKAYVRGFTSKIWPYMVQYLHFRILEFPLTWG